MAFWLCYVSKSVESSGKWRDSSVYLRGSCRQEVSWNTDDYLQLMNADRHVFDRSLELVKKFGSLHCQPFCPKAYVWSSGHFTPYCTSVHFLCQNCALGNLTCHCVVVVYTCLSPLIENRGISLQMRCSRGAALSCCRGFWEHAVFFICWNEREDLLRKKNRHFNLSFSVQACNIY